MPDVSTEVAIATTTLSSAASSITFSSIPSTYTDLRLVLVGTTTTGSKGVNLQFNSDTGTNYSRTSLYGTGAVAGSDAETNTNNLNCAAVMTATYPSMWCYDLFSYANSTYKTVLWSEAEDQNGSGFVTRLAGLWRSTSAISTIKINSTGSFATGTTATLYGIL